VKVAAAQVAGCSAAVIAAQAPVVPSGAVVAGLGPAALAVLATAVAQAGHSAAVLGQPSS